MLPKPIHPALAAARIWMVVIPVGPLLLIGAYELFRLDHPQLAPLQTGRTPDYTVLYFALVLTSLFLAVLPYFLTWGMIAFWRRRRVPDHLISERFFLLLALVSVTGIVGLLGRISLDNPLTSTLLFILPYTLAGGLGILWGIGLPVAKKS